MVVEHAAGRSVTVEHVCSAMLAESGLSGATVTVTIGLSARETVTPPTKPPPTCAIRDHRRG